MVYFQQKASKSGKIHFSSIVKTAVTSKNGLVQPEVAIKKMNLEHVKGGTSRMDSSTTLKNIQKIINI